MAQAGVPPLDATAGAPLDLEVRSIDYVPRSERHGRPWHLGAVWFVGNAELVSFATGPIGIALGLNFAWTAVAIVLGTLLGTLFMAFHSAQGPKLGLSQMIQSRAQFGYLGALLPIIAVLFVTIGYHGVFRAGRLRSQMQLPNQRTMIGDCEPGAVVNASPAWANGPG